MSNSPEFLINVNKLLEKSLFFDVFHGIPFLIAFAMIAYVFLNIRTKFISFRLFGHSLKVIRNKFHNPADPGYITPKDSIYTAVMGTVGLGSVAGVAVAVSVGGTGAIFWLFVSAILGMVPKFCEVMLGHRYRQFDKNGVAIGGPFLYIPGVLAELKMPKSIGKFLGMFYAVTIIIASFGSANMFQSNQAAASFNAEFKIFTTYPLLFPIFITAIVALTVIGNTKGIAKLAGKLVPSMTIFYVLSSLLIIAMNYKKIPETFITIFHDAFSMNACVGGIAGSMVQGFKRALFATEAGAGTSAIAHIATQTSESVRAASAAFVELLITLVVCIMTGMIIVITESHLIESNGGILLTRNAFTSVHGSFGLLLTISIFLLASTTIMGWGYYGTMSWKYLAGDNKIGVFIYKTMFLAATFYGAIVSDVTEIIKFSDYAWVLISIPNMLTLSLASGLITRISDDYLKRLKAGEFVEKQ